MRLSQENIGALPRSLSRPGYDRTSQGTGIVHFGIGAFHRAHQAVYTDAAMAAGDRDWSIAGVSFRSATVRDQLVPQDGLYTLTQRSGEGESVRLVGSVRDVLVATEAPQAVVERLANAATRIVTLTITEKGYHRALAEGLDQHAPEMRSDLAGEGPPKTIYGFLYEGLIRRRSEGLPGLTLICCDNLPQNGARLASLFGEFIERRDAGFRSWFDRECACPSTMVDRIVPATTPDDVRRLEQRLGVRDEAAVFTEPFSQWVIEDRFAGPRPRWEAGGAQLVGDVRLYEAAKLRMLNGAHSALAYLGLASGHRFVHEAVGDALIRPIVEDLLREAAASLQFADGFDPDRYARELLARFDNPAVNHRLQQIAMDGSQKIPQRWLETLEQHRRSRRQCPAILHALAAWILYLRGDGGAVEDPMAIRLRELWFEEGAAGIAPALFAKGGAFAPHWSATPADLAYLRRRLEVVA